MRFLATLTIISISTISFTQIPSYVSQDGLVGFWNFNNNVTDATGNSITTNVGGVYSADHNSVPNSAFQLSGVVSDNQYADAVNPNLPFGNSARTVSLWYQTGTFTTECHNFFISWGAASSNPGTQSQAFGFVINNEGTTLGVWSGWNDVNINYTFFSNTWYHIAVTVDVTGFCVFYINGVQEGTGNLSVPLATVANSNLALIGKSSHMDPNTQFIGLVEGRMDQLGVWNRVLTGCEIEGLYTEYDYSVTQSSTTLTVAEAGMSYQWLLCAGSTYTVIPGETNQSFNPSASGNFAVIVDNGTCEDTSACYSFTYVGTEEFSHESLGVYPNPAMDVLLVRTTLPVKAVLLNQLGEVVLNFQSNTTIDISFLESGIYFISTEQGEFKKLIIQ